jgi:hypothetical protein
MVQEMLEDDIIKPSQSEFSSLVVMVYKNYRDLKRMTIKDKFHIPIID